MSERQIYSVFAVLLTVCFPLSAYTQSPEDELRELERLEREASNVSQRESQATSSSQRIGQVCGLLDRAYVQPPIMDALMMESGSLFSSELVQHLAQ